MKLRPVSSSDECEDLRGYLLDCCVFEFKNVVLNSTHLIVSAWLFVRREGFAAEPAGQSLWSFDSALALRLRMVATELPPESGNRRYRNQHRRMQVSHPVDQPARTRRQIQQQAMVSRAVAENLLGQHILVQLLGNACCGVVDDQRYRLGGGGKRRG